MNRASCMAMVSRPAKPTPQVQPTARGKALGVDADDDAQGHHDGEHCRDEGDQIDIVPLDDGGDHYKEYSGTGEHQRYHRIEALEASEADEQRKEGQHQEEHGHLPEVVDNEPVGIHLRVKVEPREHLIPYLIGEGLVTLLGGLELLMDCHFLAPERPLPAAGW